MRGPYSCSIPCWAHWSAEDWRMLDRDGLVQILAQGRWQHRVDHMGRNVAMSALLNGCPPDMFDQLMTHSLLDGGHADLVVHEDSLGVRFPAYALRHAARLESDASSTWKAEVFARPGEFVNSKGLGVLAQVARLAGQTIHPYAWLPYPEPLPIANPATPAPAIATAFDWIAGLDDCVVDAYVANRLLVHIAGRPRAQAPDIHALEAWVLPQYHRDASSGGMDQWPVACQRMMRLVDALGKMLGMLSLGSNPHAPFQTALSEVFIQLEPDLAHLLPLCTHPDRHVVKWMLSEQRLDHLWDGLALSCKTPPASGNLPPRRI